MTDVTNEVSIHLHAHNHIYLQEMETLHRPTTNYKFFSNIDFQRSKSMKSGFMFNEKEWV